MNHGPHGRDDVAAKNQITKLIRALDREGEPHVLPVRFDDRREYRLDPRAPRLSRDRAPQPLVVASRDRTASQTRAGKGLRRARTGRGLGRGGDRGQACASIFGWPPHPLVPRYRFGTWRLGGIIVQ